jgi:methyl-accepting chemotaxis protein
VEYSALVDYNTEGAGDYYLVAKKTGKETVLEPYLYEIGGKKVLLTTFSVPVHNAAGAIVGVAGVDISLDALNQASYDSAAYKTDDICLVSGSGAYIIHSNKDNLGKNLTDIEPDKEKAKTALQAIKDGKPYSYETVSENNGQPCAKTFVPVILGNTASNWAVGVSIETGEILALTKANMILLIGIFLIILLIVAFAIGISVTRLVKKPLGALVSAAQQQARGNFDIDLESDRQDELGMLYRAIGTANGNMNDSLSTIKTVAQQVSIGASQVSDSSIQKIAPNTVIHPDPVGDFFHIGATRFADRRHGIDVRNFERQE